MVSTRSGAVVTPGKIPKPAPKPARTTNKTTTKRKPATSIASLALGDAMATASFVLLASLFNEAALVLANITHIPLLAANLAVIVLGVLLHTPVCNTLFRGALYNPSHNIAMYTAGMGTLPHHAWRMAAQILGGVLGATLAILLIPQHLQRSFSGFGLGVRPGVLLWQGLLCELVLALVLNLIVLWSMNVNPYVAYWTLLSATLVLIVVGAELTGPSMNPAISFGWFFHFKGHELLEHVLVFWVAPLTGGLLAGLGWNALAARRAGRTRAKRKTQ